MFKTLRDYWQKEGIDAALNLSRLGHCSLDEATREAADLYSVNVAHMTGVAAEVLEASTPMRVRGEFDVRPEELSATDWTLWVSISQALRLVRVALVTGDDDDDMQRGWAAPAADALLGALIGAVPQGIT